ncbi:MAG TPA: CoA transferase, partial [Dehalococcoidia bacterium]|nr:CoA transferase [Dehalococcoidia bacterium]
SVGEMLEHPHSLARDMVIEVDHARLGSVRSLGMPVKLSSLEKSELKTGAPVLGQHTGEVLSEFGYSQEEISEFVKDNVVFSSP